MTTRARKPRKAARRLQGAFCPRKRVKIADEAYTPGESQLIIWLENGRKEKLTTQEKHLALEQARGVLGELD